MDKNQRDQLTELADQATALEELASQVQSDDEQQALNALHQLEREYLQWHSKALSVLPEDLVEPFTFEYEGNILQNRIRHFIQSGRTENPLLADAEESTRRLFSTWQYPFNDVFRGPLLAQKKILIDAAGRYGASGDMLSALALLDQIFRRLPFALATLSRTIRDRPGLSIDDEYDVQRVVHAILQLHFDDVREEEWSPSYAGAATRIDFVVREARVAVETKYVRPDLTRKRLGEELATDILRYRKHPDVGALFALIYDPERRIGNPTGFEHDLFSDEGELFVRAIIVQ
jgi:hypothetical protein